MPLPLLGRCAIDHRATHRVRSGKMLALPAAQDRFNADGNRRVLGACRGLDVNAVADGRGRSLRLRKTVFELREGLTAGATQSLP